MPEQTAPDNKVPLKLKWTLAILTLVLLLILGSLLYFARKIEPITTSRIKETISTATDGLYHIKFSDIDINPITGNIQLYNIRFEPDLKVYQKLKSKGLNPTHIYTISVRSLFLKSAHPLKVYFKKDLDVKALILEQPVVRVYYQNPREEGIEPEDKRTAWQRLSKYLRSIRIRQILLNEINFQYIDQTLGKPEIDGVQNLSIRIQDLLIDSLSHLDKSRFYFSKDISVHVKNHEYLSRDKSYKVLFSELNMSSSGKFAELKGMQLLPRFPEVPVISRDGRRMRYILTMDGIRLNNIDFKRLIDRRQLRASSLVLTNTSIDVFFNRNTPKPSEDRGINFPQLALKRLRLNTIIDTVSLINSSIAYSEYSPLTLRNGKVFFNSINGHLLNFTNDSTQIKTNHWARSKFNALLCGRGNFNIAVNFNLQSPTSEYNYSGTVGEINPRVFNQILRPLAMMQFNNGQIKKASFSVEADYRKSKGTISIHYSDLSIGILRMNERKMLLRNTIASMVANDLLIEENNPSPGRPLRVGRIDYTRADSVAFLSAMWRSVYTGIKETIGITEERERNLVEQFKGLAGDDKEVREKRRDARREKRLRRRQNRDRN